MKGWLIRAEKPRSKRISCKGQPPTTTAAGPQRLSPTRRRHDFGGREKYQKGGLHLARPILNNQQVTRTQHTRQKQRRHRRQNVLAPSTRFKGLILIRRPVGCRQRVYPFASRSRRPIKGWEPVLRGPVCAHTLCSHRVSIWHRDCSPTSAAIVQWQWTPSKLSQHCNVVRRGVVPSVTGLCFGVMAWLWGHGLAAACESAIPRWVRLAQSGNEK